MVSSECRADGGNDTPPWGQPNPKAGIGASSQAARAAPHTPSYFRAGRSPDRPAGRSRLVRAPWPWWMYCFSTPSEKYPHMNDCTFMVVSAMSTVHEDERFIFMRCIHASYLGKRMPMSQLIVSCCPLRGTSR